MFSSIVWVACGCCMAISSNEPCIHHTSCLGSESQDAHSKASKVWSHVLDFGRPVLFSITHVTRECCMAISSKEPCIHHAGCLRSESSPNGPRIVKRLQFGGKTTVRQFVTARLALRQGYALAAESMKVYGKPKSHAYGRMLRDRTAMLASFARTSLILIDQCSSASYM